MDRLEELTANLEAQTAKLMGIAKQLRTATRIRQVWPDAFAGKRSVYVDARHGLTPMAGRGLPTRASIVVSDNTEISYRMTAEEYLTIEGDKYNDKQRTLITKYWEAL